MRSAYLGISLGISLSIAPYFDSAAAAPTSGEQKAKSSGKAINKAIYYDCVVRQAGETSQSEALAIVYIGFRDSPDPQVNIKAASNSLFLPTVPKDKPVLSQRVISDRQAYFWIGHGEPTRPPVMDVAIEMMPSKEKADAVWASIRKFSDTEKGDASVIIYEGSCTVSSGKPAFDRFSRESAQ